MIRILHKILIVFFIEIIFWIGSGFINKKLSLSLIFYPILFIGILIGFVFELLFAKRKRYWNEFNLFYLLINIIMLIIIVLTWLLNFYMFHFPLKIKLFNLIIPFSVFIIPLVLLISEARDEDFFNLMKLLKIWFWINLIITIIMFFAVNVLEIIPTESFFFNSRYKISLFMIAGKKLLRDPGIFEAGGTNGSFLLLFFNYFLALNFLKKSKKRFILLIIISLAIFMTLTRRSIVAMFLMISLYFVFTSLKKKNYNFYIKPIKLLILIFSLFSIVFIIIYFIPDLFREESLLARFYFWQKNLNELLGRNFYSIFKGYSIIQSALPFLQTDKFVYTDNGFLSLIIYGGIILFLSFLLYYFILFYNNLLAFVKVENDKKWIALFNLFNIITLFFVMLFSNFIFNITESIFYLFVLHEATIYLNKNL